jgi:hypothetical protein
MRPYLHQQAKADIEKKKTVYTCRHSLATRTCKTAFYIMCQYFRISFKTIVVNPDTNVHIVLAVCIVYIFLRDKSFSLPCDEEQSSVMNLPLNLAIVQKKRKYDFEA